MESVVIIHFITKRATVRGPAIGEERAALLLSSQIMEQRSERVLVVSINHMNEANRTIVNESKTTGHAET